MDKKIPSVTYHYVVFYTFLVLKQLIEIQVCVTYTSSLFIDFIPASFPNMVSNRCWLCTRQVRKTKKKPEKKKFSPFEKSFSWRLWGNLQWGRIIIIYDVNEAFPDFIQKIMEIISSVERRIEHKSRSWLDWHYFFQKFEKLKLHIY